MLKSEDFPQISGLTPTVPAPEITAMEPSENPEKKPNDTSDLNFLDRDGHLRSLEDVERDLIRFAMETYSGHMSEVARRLGIGRSTLYRKVREHGIDVAPKKSLRS